MSAVAEPLQFRICVELEAISDNNEIAPLGESMMEESLPKKKCPKKHKLYTDICIYVGEFGGVGPSKP